jgi:tRNA(Glu) U13 pseudouridine synthase TruD
MCSLTTHLILQDDFAAAADLILRPRAGEKEESTSARERFQREQKVGEALSYFPRYMHAERALLEGYRKVFFFEGRGGGRRAAQDRGY